MTDAQLWLVAAILLFILEVVTPGFVLANFGVAAMVASVAAWAGGGLTTQVIVFVITCIVSFFTVRPLFHKFLYKGKDVQVPTGTSAVIGRIAKVTDAIPGSPDYGRVQVDGDSWRAESVDGKPIPAGTTVKVIEVDSTTLKVKLIDE